MGLDFSKTAQQSVVTTPPAAKNEIEAVSYTHLTLPTILLV